MQQFKIPVDVQVEDKIVGPLTLRQLVIIGIGGGIAYAIYVLLQPKYIWTVWAPPVLFIVILTLAFAFVRIHDMSFFKAILAFIEFSLIPKNRVWKQGEGDIMISVINPPKLKEPTKKETKKSETDISKEKKIEELTKILNESTAQPNKETKK